MRASRKCGYADAMRECRSIPETRIGASLQILGIPLEYAPPTADPGTTSALVLVTDRMRHLLGIVLIAAIVGSACAQPDTVRPVTVRHTQIHVGAGIQSLGFIGIRQFIGDRLFLEGGLGVKPGI